MTNSHTTHEQPTFTRRWQTLAFFTAVFGLYVAFSFAYYREPHLFGKDFYQTFQYYYGGERPITSIYLKFQGYFSFVMYLFPWFYAKLPTEMQPYLYAWTATAMFALPMAFLFWSNLFHHWAARLLFSLLIAFWHYWENGMDEPGTMFVAGHMSFWPVCLLYHLMILQMVGDRENPRRVITLTALAIPALFSHPYTVGAMPALLYLVAAPGHKVTRRCALLLIACSIIYAPTHDTGKSNLLALLSPETMLDYIQYMVNKIFLLRYGSFSAWQAVAVLVIAGVALALWYRMRPRDFRQLETEDYLLLIFIAGLSAIYFASYRYPQYGTSVPVRYSFIQQTLWLVFVLRQVERIPLASRPLPVRASLWSGLTVVALLFQGAGSPSAFAHFHTLEVASPPLFFRALGGLERVAAKNPEVAFLVYAPYHKLPSRNFYIGQENAQEVIDFEHLSRDLLLKRLRELDATDGTLEAVRLAHEAYSVRENLARNGGFNAWDGDTPAEWDIAQSGNVELVATTWGNPKIPLLAIDFKDAEGRVTVSQEVKAGPNASGAIFHVKAHTRHSDAVGAHMTLSYKTPEGWNTFAEHTGRPVASWQRQSWDSPLPPSDGGLEVRVTFTFAPDDERCTAFLTNALFAVVEPAPEP